MSRGTIFHIVTNPDDIGYMSAEDFYEYTDSLGVDYVEDQDQGQSAVITGRLRQMIADAGFELAEIEEEYKADAAFAFRTGTQEEMDAAKQNWFRDDLDALWRKVAELDLKSFACDTGAAYDIKELADDDYGDAVYLDTGTGPATYTIAAFIRNLECGRTLLCGLRHGLHALTRVPVPA